MRGFKRRTDIHWLETSDVNEVPLTTRFLVLYPSGTFLRIGDMATIFPANGSYFQTSENAARLARETPGARVVSYEPTFAGDRVCM